MTERRERIERALHGCADVGMSDLAAPWPEIQEQANERIVAEPRRSRKFRFAPRTRASWIFAALAMMLFGTGAYAASSWVDELFGYALPQIAENDFGVPLNQSQTINGVTFTLDKAYADEGNVVVGYSVEDSNNQKDTFDVGLPRITDGSERTFKYVGGLGRVTDPAYERAGERQSELAIFDSPKELSSYGKHDFTLRLNFELKSSERSSALETESDTIEFDFGVPVREMTIIQVGRTVKANGIEMTLERVESSPARTEAILCFDPPRDNEYTWVPVVPRPDIAESDIFSNESLYGAPPEEKIGCVGYDLFRSIHDEPGSHILTVTKIEGRSPSADDPRLMVLREEIVGPWTFEFEVPEQ